MTSAEVKTSFLPQRVLSANFINTVLRTHQQMVKPRHDFNEKVHAAYY